MGKGSGISWTDHTFNPWWGCTKVSPACDSCYAETFAHRMGENVWGKDADRRFFGDKHWNDPLRWDRQAAKDGRPALVFCASMADVFEDRRDLDAERGRLWNVIDKTPNLRWMLLTKRPETITRMLPAAWLADPHPRVWLGVTAENQRRAEERIPVLAEIPAAVRWISAEPLLSDIDFSPWIADLDWIIVGGESGWNARRMAPEWATNILGQCQAAGIAYHFKQKGDVLAKELGCKNKSGKDASEWPAEFRVQEFPAVA